MTYVSTINIHGAERIGAEFVVTPNGSRWITVSFGSCSVNCYSRDDDPAARFERIAEAIAAVNAEFDAKGGRDAARADAEAAFNIAAE